MKIDFILTNEFKESTTVDEQLAKRIEIRSMLSKWLRNDPKLAKWMKENHIESLFIFNDENKE